MGVFADWDVHADPPLDEVAEIGVDLSEKQNIEHMEDVNVELMDETEREEVAAQEPVPGARPNVLV